MPTIAQIAAQARARAPGAPGPAAPAVGGTTVREIAARAAPPPAPAPLNLRPTRELQRMPAPAAQAEVSRRATGVMRARADPTTYLGGARAPKPTGAERAIGFAGQRVGVPLLMAGRALPGGELGYQLMRRFAPEETRAARAAVETSLAVSPMVPKWVPGIGGFQPVRMAMQIAPYVAGGAAGGAGVAAIPARVAGLMAVGAEQRGARGIGQGMAPLDVAATAATGALEIGSIAGAFQVGGMLAPRGKWARSLTPFEQAARRAGLPAGPPPPPGAMQMLGEKIRGWRAGKAVGFPRAKGGVVDVPIFAKWGQRPGESVASFAKRLKRGGRLGTELYREMVDSNLFSGLPVPRWSKRAFVSSALKVAGITQDAATQIYNALGQHGGDVVKAAVAIGVEEGLARKLAEAIKPGPLRRERSAVLEAQLKEFVEEQGYDPANLGVADARNLLDASDAETEFSRPGFASWLLEQTDRQSTRDFLEKEAAVAGRGVEAVPVGVPPAGVQPAPPAAESSTLSEQQEQHMVLGAANEFMKKLAQENARRAKEGLQPIHYTVGDFERGFLLAKKVVAATAAKGRTLTKAEYVALEAENAQEWQFGLDRKATLWGEPGPVVEAAPTSDQAARVQPTPPLPAEATPKPKERRVYDEDFEKYLRDSGVPYVAVDEAKKALFAGVSMDSFDFVVYRESGPNWLVTCRPFKNKGITEKMGSWEEVFGEGFVAVEVVRGPAGMVARTLSGEETLLPAEKVELGAKPAPPTARAVDLFGQPPGKAKAPPAEKGPPEWKQSMVPPSREPQPGEPGYAPPAVAGLFGQETAKAKQPELWGERGVEAIWRKVEGVPYVKVADGKAVTRSDGTGALIPLDEPDFEARLLADARKAAPPAKPAPPAGLAPGVAVEKSGMEEVAGAKVGVRRQGEVRAAPDGSLHVVDSETGEASSLEGWGRADLSSDQATAFRKHMAKKFPPEAPPAPAVAEAMAGRPAEAEPPAAPAVNATLAAQAAAKKQGIDLATIKGTGSKGLITRKDVRGAEKLKRIQEASARVGAPLRPGTLIEQTRQALEDAGLETRRPFEPAPAAREEAIAPPEGREAAPPPRKPPVTPPKAPPAAPEPEPGQEEEVPLEVLARGAPRAAPTMAIFKDLSAAEVIRHLTKIRGPIGSLAKYKEVGMAVEELRDAMKREKAAEAAEKEYLEKMQAAYPDITVGGETIGEEGGGLLGLLGESRIVYGKGVELGVEIQEAVEGLPKAIRRHFIHVKYLGGVGKLKGERGAGAMTIENLQMRWLGSVDVPPKTAPSLSETFDRLMVEIKAYEAARAEGAVSVEEALRRLARTVPEDVGEGLVTRADALAAETTAVDQAREKLLAAAEPYLAVGGETIVQVVEEPEAKAAERMAGLRRQLEDLRTRAMGERTLSQALREDVFKVARTMARRFPELGPKFLTEKLAAVDSPKQAEALIDWMQKHAATAERRAARLGVEKRMARMRKNVGALEEPYHTLVREALGAFDPSRPRERTVRGLESTIAFVDEHPELEALLPAKRLRDIERLVKKPLADLDLKELRDLDGYFEWWERLAETKGRLKIGQHLRDYFADVDEGETQILASGRDVPAHRRKEGTWRRILKRGVLDTGTIGRDLGGASDPVDRALDAEAAAEKDSQAIRYLARNLWEGERESKNHLVSFLKRIFAACEATDAPFGSKALIEAMEKRVTVELPTATDMAGRTRVPRITLSAAELGETVLDYEDPNTVRQAALAGDCWDMPRTKDLDRPGPTDPKIRLGVRDVAALRDALAGQPKVQQVAYALHEIYNDPATFRAMDDTIFELDMRHLIKEGPYHPRSRNWQMEGPPRVPESFGDMRDVFLEHLGPAQARTGTSAAVVHGNLFSKAMNHFTTVSRIVGLARAVRGAWMFLDSKAIKRAMINRHGTGLVDFYKAVIRNLMGTGITPPSNTEAVARAMMHRFAVAALGLRVQTGLRQVWSTWNTADVLGPKAVAEGYKNFLSHKRESLDELMKASPIAWLRLHYYGGTDALLSGPSATIEHQYGKKTLGERMLVLVRMGDGVGVGALWEACKAWGAKNGVTDPETLGRLWEDLLNEEGAGPTTAETYQSLLATEARRSVLARIGTFFGNFRNRIVNKIWKRVIDVRNDPGNPEVWKKLFRALVVVLLGTTVPMVGVMAGTRWVLSGGKRRPTGTGLALDAVENTVGNVYLMGDAFYAGRRVLERGTVYGAGARQNPLARVVTSWIQGAGGVYLGVDQAISGERYRAGVRKGERKAPRTLGRAASSLLEAVGYSLGLPVAPLSYWRGALRFAEGEGVAAAIGEKADAADLAWKASGGDAEAARRLKEQGISLAEARRALRRRLESEGVGVRERVERLRRLTQIWNRGGPGLRGRARARSSGLGQSGASFGAVSGPNRRFLGFRGKTAPIVGA